MSTTLQSAGVLIFLGASFFCDFFGVTAKAGKRLKQSHNGLQTTFEGFLEFFHRTPGRSPNAHLAAFSAAAALAGHAATAPGKPPDTHIHAPFSQ
ncbi:hypothetical protein M3I54_06480 [Paraburkholderia sp. CNPSo 3274]|uniref:hypothetical protein n=1 Tax=Paraburkholderia sp. CNPSo 3274 TaxID=2940932 RepID=UPI0020B7EF44|nr:hypothetical protein [Paraburkholderia sp. CNPSo 3274]MCP3706635.1 hypothetical protein [Paraburkholderia sp. CNPSo 3274]